MVFSVTVIYESPAFIVIAIIDIFLRRAHFDCSICFGNSHYRSRIALPVEVKTESSFCAQIGIADREPLAGIISVLREHLEESCLDVSGRILGEYVIVPVRAGLVSGSLQEPRVLASRMVEHIVEVDVDALCLGFRQEVAEIVLGTIFRIEGEIVQDIVSMIRHGRMDRRKPEGCHSHHV